MKSTLCRTDPRQRCCSADRSIGVLSRRSIKPWWNHRYVRFASRRWWHSAEVGTFWINPPHEVRKLDCHIVSLHVLPMQSSNEVDSDLRLNRCPANMTNRPLFMPHHACQQEGFGQCDSAGGLVQMRDGELKQTQWHIIILYIYICFHGCLDHWTGSHSWKPFDTCWDCLNISEVKTLPGHFRRWW